MSETVWPRRSPGHEDKDFRTAAGERSPSPKATRLRGSPFDVGIRGQGAHHWVGG